MKIPKFRGTFSKDTLPLKLSPNGESGIVNLEDFHAGEGSHWVAYSTTTGTPCYFDSFGNLSPPRSIAEYLGPGIKYNYERVQNFNQIWCGHFCLYFLKSLSKDKNYETVLDEMA